MNASQEFIATLSPVWAFYVENQIHTVRMHCRRLSGLTNAFSKKREKFEATVSPHYAYYNLCKILGTLRCTPAQEAGVEDSQWTVADIAETVKVR